MTITMSARGMRERADEGRAVAAATTLPLVRATALAAAETWDRMADVAERTTAAEGIQSQPGYAEVTIGAPGSCFHADATPFSPARHTS